MGSFAVKPRSLFLLVVAGAAVASTGRGQQAAPTNEETLREVWQTSPDSQKISSDAAATQLLPGVYSESGIDYTSTFFIFPDHSYAETGILLPDGELWEEGSWQFDRGIIKLNTTWRRHLTRAAPRDRIYLPVKVSPDGAFGLFSQAKTFAEHSTDLARYGYSLEKRLTAVEIPALKKRFKHLRLLNEARQQFMINGNADEEPPAGNQDVIVFKSNGNSLPFLLFKEGGVIGNLSVPQFALISKRIEIPYDLQSVSLIGPVEIQGDRGTVRTYESDLIYFRKTQRITGKNIEIRINDSAQKISN